MKKAKYTLIVGNVGNIEFYNKKMAIACYNEYVRFSVNNIGRAAGEDVTLMKGDDILMEYFGAISEAERN